MDGGTVTLICLVVVNIAGVAFSYGMLTQKVKDLCRRMGGVEKKLGINPGQEDKP